MLINRPAGILLALLLLPAGGAAAFDGDLSPNEAFRMGYKSYKAGDTETALEALNFAAEQGHTAALWKLGRMHANGDGVAQNDGKAFDIFMRIAGDSSDANPRSRDARYVADALVSLGRYYETGIANRLEANPAVSRQIYSHAAAYFGDAEAQFQLARMHERGLGGDRNPRQAARWYKLAARKGHAGAQAHFGLLLMKGEGTKRNSVKGLMWLSLARRQSVGNANISELYQNAFSSAPEDDRETAMAMADKWLQRQIKN
jgi:TPR repeat protein